MALHAASDLEDLAEILKQIIIDLREKDSADAYARVYWFRREVGYITSGLGEGVPNRVAEIGSEYWNLDDDE